MFVEELSHLLSSKQGEGEGFRVLTDELTPRTRQHRCQTAGQTGRPAGDRSPAVRSIPPVIHFHLSSRTHKSQQINSHMESISSSIS